MFGSYLFNTVLEPRCEQALLEMLTTTSTCKVLLWASTCHTLSHLILWGRCYHQLHFFGNEIQTYKAYLICPRLSGVASGRTRIASLQSQNKEIIPSFMTSLALMKKRYDTYQAYFIMTGRNHWTFFVHMYANNLTILDLHRNTTLAVSYSHT